MNINLILMIIFGTIAFISPFWGLALMVALIPIEGMFALMQTFTFIKFLGIVTFISFIIRCSIGKESIKADKFIVISATLVIWGLITTLWARYPNFGYMKSITLAQLILFSFMILSMVNSWTRFISIIIAFIGGALLASFKTIIFYLTGLAERASALATQNPNNMGRILAIALILVIFLMIEQKKFKFMYYIISIPMFIALIMTGSRGSWIAFAGGLIIVFLFTFKKFSLGVNILIVMLIFGLTLIFGLKKGLIRPYIAKRAEQVIEAKNISTAIGSRWIIYQVALEMIKDNFLLGVGLGNFPWRYKDYVNKVKGAYVVGYFKDAHNSFICIFAETGIFGFLLFVFLFLFLIWKLINNPQLFKKNIFTLLFSLLAVIFISSVSGTNFGKKYFWFVISLVDSVILSKLYFPRWEEKS